MSFLVLLAALLLQHYRPLQQDPLRQAMQAWADWLEHHFNDDEPHHGKLAWLLAVALPVIVTGIAHWLLDDLGHVPAMLLAIAVLYLTLRLDSFTGHPERIATHLRAEQLPAARAQLTAWQGSEAADYSAAQVARAGIEQTLLHAHHHVFAPVFWFILLGPAGALAYRLADLLRQAWSPYAEFGDFARQAFDWLDWLPSRFTAGAFAVMGDFEDAVYCWRTQASSWPQAAAGMILASGAGALGVRLGEALPGNGTLVPRPELGMGDEADADYLQSSIGLVWRVLVLTVALLLLLTFAHWLGT